MNTTTTQIDAPAIPDTTTLQAVTTDRKPPGVVYPPWDGEWVEDETARNPYMIDGDVCFVKLTRGLVAVCELRDWQAVKTRRWWAISTRNGFYAAASIDEPGKRGAVLMHRIVFGDSDKLIDHWNRDKMDNRRTNLRACTNQQNCINGAARKNNTSGFLGVKKVTGAARWQATVAGVYIGSFMSKVEAANARDKAAAAMFGQFATRSAREPAAELDKACTL
jgi:hypothetical protein